MAQLVSQAEYARMNGWERSYVTKLKQQGRLVMDGDLVNVEASQERVQATRDPNRDDVAERHAQAKNGGAATGDVDKIGNSYQAARAIKEKYLAAQAKADYEKSIGKLLENDSVRRLAIDVGATTRTALERIPNRYSSELAAEGDEQRVYAILVEAVEEVLTDISRKLEELGRAAVEPR